ncbi:MAG TPA: hypothetical protein VEL74_05885 [Thermoanaerobaculia bacterium]|nr:hypothetical protein [Thermoanaerobaculia bacterium]
MKSPHLLRVEEGPERFAPLIEAARAEGLRVGWLDLAPPPPMAGDLETAAAAGVLRAVAVGGDRSVVVKPLRGAPVLQDLLREHFRGTALVLVRGELEAPLLRWVGEEWEVTVPGQAAVRLETGRLVPALRKPRPWA